MSDMVFLVDVDNTLLDNDRVRVELERTVADIIGPSRMSQFFDLYEQVREEMEFVNFPETLERFSRVCDDVGCIGGLSHTLYSFQFAECVYPDALVALEHLRSLGRPVILSDGDQLFQRHKIRTAGLEAAVDGRVLVYVHKEQETDDIRERYPARHYVMLDDKPRIHAALKPILGGMITTVQVRQGKYALEPDREYRPEPDLTIETIGDAVGLTTEQLMAAAG